MAPATDVLVVQVVQFYANDRCMADPSLFRAVRNMAQGWQEKGLKAQHWGTAARQANDVYWLLFWQSHAHAAAVKADPLYPILVQKRQALATAPVHDFHVCFSGNPRRTIEVPVTEVDLYRTNDAGAAETQERIRRVTHRVESLQMQGFIALSWGVTVEDGTRGVYLGGWRSIEEHMRLGTLDDHKVFVEECEEIFKNFRELSVAHVTFKAHEEM
ncbi:hypothetical protein F5148DRAFT_698813 [Russula earlei]|uniref:Uncharacterized protein n=1 Tax=Russula earlei TaxID=71964 RepID=A0ACC0TUS0_9AGAM|nr:hypothetical protein F5148DRAFT_698813 [Russula earlei]